MPIDSTPPPPKPPTPPSTRIVKDCGGDKPLTKSDWAKGVAVILLIFLLIPPVTKLYMWWTAIWS